MTLSRKEIKKCCKKNKLIDPYKEENIQTCSYDLTFSGEYYYYKESDGNQVIIRQLEEGEKLHIPADAICYVMTEESVNMPANLTASISLAFGLVKRGVMLAAQPPYDPGYSGKTVALLHNLSDNAVEISRGEHILNIVFNQLSSPVHTEDLYKGKYQNLKSLHQYCTQVRKGAVFVLKEDFEDQKRKFVNFLPTILSIITFIVAILTVLFTITTATDIYGRSSAVNTGENQQKVNYYVDEKNNILTIIIDGKCYRLDLKEEASQANKGEGDLPGEK